LLQPSAKKFGRDTRSGIDRTTISLSDISKLDTVRCYQFWVIGKLLQNEVVALRSSFGYVRYHLWDKLDKVAVRLAYQVRQNKKVDSNFYQVFARIGHNPN
jgi:hypothetical protein